MPGPDNAAARTGNTAAGPCAAATCHLAAVHCFVCTCYRLLLPAPVPACACYNSCLCKNSSKTLQKLCTVIMVWTGGIGRFAGLRGLQLLPATSQPSTVSPAPATACYCLSLFLPAPATARTCYCLRLLLPMAVTACGACYCLRRLLRPATACACCCLRLLAGTTLVQCNSNSCSRAPLLGMQH